MFVTNAESTTILRRALEGMLEGSEKILISCTSRYMEFQIMDAMSLCSVSLKVGCIGFLLFPPRSQIKATSLQTDLRPLHHFLKRNATARHVRFQISTDKTRPWTVMALAANQRVLDSLELLLSRDETPYVDMTPSLFTKFTRFHMDPHEFALVTLDLASGGGCMDVHVYANNVVSFASRFPTGQIAFHCFRRKKSTPSTHVRKRARFYTPPLFKIERKGGTDSTRDPIHGRYIIKFLKLVCGVTPICEDMVIYIEQNWPLILYMRFSDAIQMTVSVAPNFDEKKNTA